MFDPSSKSSIKCDKSHFFGSTLKPKRWKRRPGALWSFDVREELTDITCRYRWALQMSLPGLV